MESISTTLRNLSIEHDNGSPLSLARKLRRTKRRLLLQHVVERDHRQQQQQQSQPQQQVPSTHRGNSFGSYGSTSDAGDDLSAVRKLRRMKRRLLLDLANQPEDNTPCCYPPSHVTIVANNQSIMMENMNDSFGCLSTSSSSED